MRRISLSRAFRLSALPQALEAALERAGLARYDPAFALASRAYKGYLAKCETARECDRFCCLFWSIMMSVLALVNHVRCDVRSAGRCAFERASRGLISRPLNRAL